MTKYIQYSCGKYFLFITMQGFFMSLGSLGGVIGSLFAGGKPEKCRVLDR